MAIKLVSFDLDNTLWETDQVIFNAEQRQEGYLKQQIPDYGDLSRQQKREIYDLVRSSRADISHDVSSVRLVVLERLCLLCGCNLAHAKTMAKRAFDIFISARQEVVPYDFAEELLKQLHKDYFIATITNGNAVVQKTPLGKYVDHAICAADVGAMKPRAEPFLRAIKLASCQPEESVHIGDNLEDDIGGAKDVGMFTIWSNFGRSQERCTADAEIASLDEIPAVLRRLGDDV